MIKISATRLKVGATTVRIVYSVGPWIDGVDPTTIKIYPAKMRALFPAEIRAAFKVENNSDMMTDYFEDDFIRITSAHPLYGAVKSAAYASGARP